MILEVKDLHAFYGESHILHGVNMKVDEGKITCLLGRNGVGKTTLLKAIMGLVDKRRGEILYKGKDLIGMPPYKIAQLGIAFVPEDSGIFPDLTVKENLLTGLAGSKKGSKTIPEKVFEYFPILKERLDQKGGTLSGGEQKMLAIARALVQEPELILLDEFTQGLQPSIVQKLVEIVKQINKDGTSLLLVEQNSNLALNIADWGYIMEKGQIVYSGMSKELSSNISILHKYLVI
jgi:branched-chain amino acid transport system ATP-binding protein